MGKRIYLAAPIHKEEDAESNRKLISILRRLGFDVWSPQEAGIASVIAKEQGRDLNEVRREMMRADLTAMKCCDICLAHLDRDSVFSEGMLWEIGWFSGMNRPVVVWNRKNVKVTLMVEFTADYYITDDNIDRVVEVLGRI